MGKWKPIRLRDVGVSLIDCVHKTPVAQSAGYPYIGIPQMKNGRIDFSTARLISREDYLEWTKKAKPQKNDVILSRRTNPGVTAIDDTGTEFALGQNLVLLRADGSKVYPPFLKWMALSPFWWEQISKFNNVGAVFDSLKCADVPNFELPVPPLDLQKSIAELLGALDDKIELNRRMNEALEAMAQATFKDWFVDFGPTRAKMEGRAPYLAAEIWSLYPDRLDDEGKPEGWINSTVGSEFNLTMGQSPPGETYNEHGEGLPFFQGKTDFGFRYPIRRKYCSAPTRVARPDDTLVSVRAPVGDLNMAWEDCCIGRGLAAVRHRRGGRGYTQYSLRFMQPEIARFEDSGSVFGAINKAQFERLQVIAPTSTLIDAFEVVVESMDDRIRANTSESDALAAMRDLLLPKLMSGEVHVKDAEKLVGEAI